MKTGVETKYGHLHAVCARCFTGSVSTLRSRGGINCCECGRSIPVGEMETYQEDDTRTCKMPTYEAIR